MHDLPQHGAQSTNLPVKKAISLPTIHQAGEAVNGHWVFTHTTYPHEFLIRARGWPIFYLSFSDQYGKNYLSIHAAEAEASS